MSRDVALQRKRVGGNWVIAQAVPNRALRDVIRQELDSEVFFITLTLTTDDLKNRIRGRHGDNEMVVNMFIDICKKFEPVEVDEPNGANIVVTEEMTKDEVMNKVLELVN